MRLWISMAVRGLSMARELLNLHRGDMLNTLNKFSKEMSNLPLSKSFKVSLFLMSLNSITMDVNLILIFLGEETFLCCTLQDKIQNMLVVHGQMGIRLFKVGMSRKFT